MSGIASKPLTPSWHLLLKRRRSISVTLQSPPSLPTVLSALRQEWDTCLTLGGSSRAKAFQMDGLPPSPPGNEGSVSHREQSQVRKPREVEAASSAGGGALAQVSSCSGTTANVSADAATAPQDTLQLLCPARGQERTRGPRACPPTSAEIPASAHPRGLLPRI